jgi:hypothetical protein
MAIATQSGYVWTSGRKARMVHNGNSKRIRNVSATQDSGTTADLVLNGLTQDRWTPFSNELIKPEDFSDTDNWTATGLTVGEDGQEVDEGSSAGTHELEQAFTFTASDYVAGLKVELADGLRTIRFSIDDGTTVQTCDFDLSDLSSDAGGEIVDLGRGKYQLRFYFTAAAGTGSFSIQLSNGSTSYTGEDEKVRFLKASLHESEAILQLNSYVAEAASCFAIAAHNLGSSACRITLEHDSNEDDTWTSLGEVTPIDDSPIMFFFNEVTSRRWRLRLDRGVDPRIGVVRVSDPLVLTQGVYSGFTPARMNRTTELVGNMSRSGELLGRSKRRTNLAESFSWSHLTYDWVRANLDGVNGVIQSLEADSAFIAWRPELTQDASYVMRAQTSPPVAMGLNKFWEFSMSAEVHSYE